MTTMDSDSESQDSDEGRRFRFETTRKDSNIGTNTRKRRSTSPSQRGAHKSSRRSRSRDRTTRPGRHEISRTRQDNYRKSRERTGMRENFRYSRDFEKITTHRETTTTTASRAVSPNKFSRREHTTRTYEKKRSHDRFDNHRAVSTERRDKFRDRIKRSSPVEQHHASRERTAQSSRMKNNDITRTRDDNTRLPLARKTTRRSSDRGLTKSPNDLIVKKYEKHDNITLIDQDSRQLQDCKDLNLSDFDIVSDTEELSSDNSQHTRRNFHDNVDVGNENCQFYENNEGIRKRVTKQHYERLLKRQAVKKRRNLEELNCPKVHNGRDDDDDDESATSDVLNEEKTKSPVATSSVRNIDSHDVSKLVGDSRNDILSDRMTIRDENMTIHEGEDSLSNDSSWGPILPPKRRDDEETSVTPENMALPSDKVIGEKTLRILGPNLPENFRNFKSNDDAKGTEEDSFGPALPPHLSALSNDDNDEELCFDDDKDTCEEKAVPLSDDDDDDFMGPLPIDHPALENDVVQQQLERRARRLKAELAACDNEDEKKREEWMIELPPAKSANLGLGARKFRSRPAPDMSDRSSWTDTPADRARKRMEKLENKGLSESTRVTERESRDTSIEMEKSRKREKSLLEIHQKKLHKKKKKEEKEAKKIGKTAERRPFDRDIDLQANRFDEARKKSMLMKSRELDDRFSRGKI